MPKTLTDFSPQKIYKCQINIWKDAPYLMSSEKWKLKWQQDTTTWLLQWAKFRTLLKTSNTSEDSGH